MKPNKLKLNILDVVMTRYGTVTVVSRVDCYGNVCIVLPYKSKQRQGWYAPHELRLVGSLANISISAVYKLKEPMQ